MQAKKLVSVYLITEGINWPMLDIFAKEEQCSGLIRLRVLLVTELQKESWCLQGMPVYKMSFRLSDRTERSDSATIKSCFYIVTIDLD